MKCVGGMKGEELVCLFFAASASHAGIWGGIGRKVVGKWSSGLDGTWYGCFNVVFRFFFRFLIGLRAFCKGLRRFSKGVFVHFLQAFLVDFKKALVGFQRPS